MNISSALDQLRRDLPEKTFEHLTDDTITTAEYIARRVRVWFSRETSLVTDITHG